MLRALSTFVISCLSAVFPQLIFAQSSNPLDFTPPATDLSVKYLGAIFGVVDGALSGSGSQILGNIFGVFNAAILAIGGIVLIYMLIIGTLNTAQEGEFLGKQWSSLWIPIRVVMGVALLMPKASGYCLMQIFVMWIIVQGIGVADKIWGTALDFMARGGVLMDVQRVRQPLMDAPADGGQKVAAAQSIMQAQVCMAGLQNILEKVRREKLGPPNVFLLPGAKPDRGAVPDFIGSVNFSQKLTGDACKNSAAGSLKSPCVLFPNFPTGLYAEFNGICGGMHWAELSDAEIQRIKENLRLSASDSGRGVADNLIKEIQNARKAATQQMYITLSGPSRSIVNNYIDSKVVLPLGMLSPQQDLWLGKDGKPPLMKGLELKNAASDYFTIMAPTLRALQQSYETSRKTYHTDAEKKQMADLESEGKKLESQLAFFREDCRGTMGRAACAKRRAVEEPRIQKELAEAAAKARQIQANPTGVRTTGVNDFIAEAYREGWVMAGSYFSKLMNLNRMSANLIEDKDVLQLEVSSAVSAGNSKCPETGGPAFCDAIRDLRANHTDWYTKKLIENVLKRDEYSQYLQDATKIRIGGAGTPPPERKHVFNPMPKIPTVYEPKTEGNPLQATFWQTFLPSIGAMYLNTLIVLINVMIGVVNEILNFATHMSSLFLTVNRSIISSGEHPLVALGSLGNLYMNVVGMTWVALGVVGLTGFVPFIGYGVITLLLMLSPFLILWSGIMLTTGFIMAFYLPLLPFITFLLGVVAWFVLVIEAMVGAPLWAFSFILPGGESQQLGRGERGLFLLINVFFRPALMIVGFIILIIVSYVVFWALSVGFDRAITGILGETVATKVTETTGCAKFDMKHGWTVRADQRNEIPEGYAVRSAFCERDDGTTFERACTAEDYKHGAYNGLRTYKCLQRRAEYDYTPAPVSYGPELDKLAQQADDQFIQGVNSAWSKDIQEYLSPTFVINFIGTKTSGFGSFFGLLFAMFFFELLLMKIMTDLCTRLIGEFPSKAMAYLSPEAAGGAADMGVAKEGMSDAKQLAGAAKDTGGAAREGIGAAGKTLPSGAGKASGKAPSASTGGDVKGKGEIQVAGNPPGEK